MPKAKPDLAAVIDAHLAVRAPGCVISHIIAAATETDTAQLDRLLVLASSKNARARLSYKEVGDILTEFSGDTVSEYAVGRHIKGTCACA